MFILTLLNQHQLYPLDQLQGLVLESVIVFAPGFDGGRGGCGSFFHL